MVVASAEPLEAALKRLEGLSAIPITKGASTVDADRVKTIITEAQIPKRHNRDIEATGSKWDEKFSTLKGRLGSGFLHALAGTQGTGKTQMGACLIRAAALKLWSCRFSTAMDFFIELKGTFDDDSKITEAQAIARFTKPKLLVLDEMDERSESAWENRLIFYMVNKRYNEEKDTLLISRRDKDVFLSSLGESIQSRMQETGSVMVCDWQSFRDKA